MRRASRAASVVAIGAVLTAGLVACGDDDDDAVDGGPTTEATDVTTGAGDTAGTDTAAATDEVDLAGGVTALTLAGPITTVLDAASVEVSGVDPATSSGSTVAIPISGGTLTVDPLAGMIEHEGGVAFSAAGASVEVTDLVIDAGDGVVRGEVEGREIPVFDMDLTGAQVDAAGDPVISGADAQLAGDFADAVDEALGLDILQGGLTLGEVTVSPG